jgi:threonine dehydrogenase-like Zn-dependent dehydrogenase
MDKEIRFSWLAPMVWPTTIHALANGLVKVESLITSTIPLADAGKAIEALKERDGDPLKVIVRP